MSGASFWGKMGSPKQKKRPPFIRDRPGRQQKERPFKGDGEKAANKKSTIE